MAFKCLKAIEKANALYLDYRYRVKTEFIKYVHELDTTFDCVVDAKKHLFENMPTIHFLYNPFGSETMHSFAKRLSMNMGESDIVVLVNPIRAYILEFSGLEVVKSFKHWNHNREVSILARTKS